MLAREREHALDPAHAGLALAPEDLVVQRSDVATDAGGARQQLARLRQRASGAIALVDAVATPLGAQMLGVILDSNITTDGAGNTSARTRGVTQTFTWNAQNRLYKIEGYNLIESFFLSYDAFGRRVHQQISGGSTPTELFYVGADFEYDKTLQQSNLFFFVGGQRIASIASFGNYYAGAGWTAWDDFGWRVGPPLAGLVVLLGLAGVAVLATRRRPAWLAGAGAGFLGAGILLLPIPARTGGGGGGSVHGSHGEQTGVYYLPDHLGSTRAVVDLYGAVLETRDYDPWGNSIAHTGTYSLKHRFTSQPISEVDAGGGYGLHNYGARFYDPKWGRFVSSDEMVEGFDSQGINSFAYVRSRPTSLLDPTGNMVCCSVWDMWFYSGASWHRPSSDIYQMLEFKAGKQAHAEAEIRQGEGSDAVVRAQLKAENITLEKILAANRAAAHGIDPITVGVQSGTTTVAGDAGADVTIFSGVEISGEGVQDGGAVVTFSGIGEISGLEADADTFVLTVFRGEIEDFASFTVWDISIGATFRVYISPEGRFSGLGVGVGPGYGASKTRSAAGYFRTQQSGEGTTPRRERR